MDMWLPRGGHIAHEGKPSTHNGDFAYTYFTFFNLFYLKSNNTSRIYKIAKRFSNLNNNYLTYRPVKACLEN